MKIISGGILDWSSKIKEVQESLLITFWVNYIKIIFHILLAGKTRKSKIL
jgi:hypothetical protein